MQEDHQKYDSSTRKIYSNRQYWRLMKQPIPMTEYRHVQHLGRGVIYAIVSALAFAVMSVFVKMIGTDLPTAMPIFFRFAISLVLLLPWVFAAIHFVLNSRSRYVI